MSRFLCIRRLRGPVSIPLKSHTITAFPKKNKKIQTHKKKICCEVNTREHVRKKMKKKTKKQKNKKNGHKF